MVHPLLESTVEVGEGLCTRAEAHAFAEVIPSFSAVFAIIAHHTALDSDTLADTEVSDTGTNGGDDAGRLMAKHQRRLDAEVAVAAVREVVEVGAAETRSTDSDLGFASGGRPEGSALGAQVVRAVADNGGGGTEAECGGHDGYEDASLRRRGGRTVRGKSDDDELDGR